MRAYYLRCPVCETLDQEPIAPSFHVFGDPLAAPAPAGGEETAVQLIWICRRCGMVLRNPYVPEMCPTHYMWESVDAVRNFWVNPTFLGRASRLADEIVKRVRIPGRKAFLDVGTGPGMVPKLIADRFPTAQPVLLEPSINSLMYAKAQIPSAVCLPGSLEEVDLPEQSFSLVTVLGVDYLFANHRRAMEKLAGLLADEGVLYIERFFLDQPALYKQPILDMEDLLGRNFNVNTWFGREQFVEYLGQFFDVFDQITYTYDVTPPPLPRETSLTGVFCRRRPTDKIATRQVSDFYAAHLELLRARAPQSSLEDLRNLAERGVRTAVICGTGAEARALAEMIRDRGLFTIVGFLEVDERDAERKALTAEFVSADASGNADAILVASVSRQQQFMDALRARGLDERTYPCFRTGLQRFWSFGETRIQMKAFLPSMLHGLRTASVLAR